MGPSEVHVAASTNLVSKSRRRILSFLTLRVGGAQPVPAAGRIAASPAWSQDMPTYVTETPAASSDIALRHFQDMLTFETDCGDVHESLKAHYVDVIIVAVRGPNAFAEGHVKRVINIPHREMTAERMSQYPKGKMYVVYCAGPHCNGANKAAVRLARLGLPVKMMIGGVTGWLDEGFTLTA